MAWVLIMISSEDLSRPYQSDDIESSWRTKHFGPKTVRIQDTSALFGGFELSGLFSTSAEVSKI